MIESYRSFKKLYEQEERIINHIEKRMQHLEPVPNDANKVQRTSKTVIV